MTEKEMERFLEMMDEHEKKKQREMDKKKARIMGSIFLFVFALSIIMVFLMR